MQRTPLSPLDQFTRPPCSSESLLCFPSWSPLRVPPPPPPSPLVRTRRCRCVGYLLQQTDHCAHPQSLLADTQQRPGVYPCVHEGLIACSSAASPTMETTASLLPAQTAGASLLPSKAKGRITQTSRPSGPSRATPTRPSKAIITLTSLLHPSKGMGTIIHPTSPTNLPQTIRIITIRARSLSRKPRCR